MTIRKKRPLSPHLTIYKPQISSMLSILHRITGAALFIGLLCLSWLVVGLIMQNMGLAFIDCRFDIILDSVAFKVLLLALSFCLYYHMLNGVRHLFWDVGLGFEIKTMEITGFLVVLSSLLLTGVTLYFAMLHNF